MKFLQISLSKIFISIRGIYFDKLSIWIEPPPDFHVSFALVLVQVITSSNSYLSSTLKKNQKKIKMPSPCPAPGSDCMRSADRRVNSMDVCARGRKHKSTTQACVCSRSTSRQPLGRVYGRPRVAEVHASIDVQPRTDRRFFSDGLSNGRWRPIRSLVSCSPSGTNLSAKRFSSRQ
mgnify:CR=1 FL=1